MTPNEKYRLSEVIHGLPAGPQDQPGQQTVNNFAAATGAACGFRMAAGFHFLYPTGFPAPTGQTC
jgi:hypothetical protein